MISTVVGCSRQPTILNTPNPDPNSTGVIISSTETNNLPTPNSNSHLNGNAEVEYVIAIKNDDGTWTFTVTVSHLDKGWDDYADGWDIITPAGEVIKQNSEDKFTRLLLHPHVNEQPFTRSQSGIRIPENITQVIVRAHDLKDGYGGNEVLVDLQQPEGDSFEVRDSN